MNYSTPPSPSMPRGADGTTCHTSVQSTDTPLVITTSLHPVAYGEQQQEPQDEMHALVDYIAMTVPRCKPEDAVRIIGYEPEQFVPTNTTIEERRLWGYRQRWDHEWIKVMFSMDNPDAGVRVEMAGHACRQWESEHPEQTLIDLLEAGRTVSVTMHRLDAAIDDHANILDLDEVERARTDKHFTFIGNKHHSKVGEEADDRTIYFGSRKSDIAFRMYRHQQPACEAGGEPARQWNRFEMETHRRKAQELRDLIVELGSVGRAVAGVTRHYLNFRVPKPGDSNKSRWDVAPYWLAFLGGAEKARLAKPKPLARVEGVVAWLRRQAAVYMALARRYGGNELIEALLMEGEGRLKPHHLAMLPTHLRDRAPSAMDDFDAEREEEYAEYLAWRDAEEAEARRREREAEEPDVDEDWDHCGFAPVMAARRSEGV